MIGDSIHLSNTTFTYFYRIHCFHEYPKKDCYEKVYLPNYSFRLDYCTVHQEDGRDLLVILKSLDNPTE